jgi:hypothetical protein
MLYLYSQFFFLKFTKVIESYKDPDPNYTMRRQMEHEHGETKQMDCLRRVGYRNF